MHESLVLDGGPCAGKTTGAVKIIDKAISTNRIPLFVPEAASLLISSGITPKNIGNQNFQRQIAALQLQNENFWNTSATILKDLHGKTPLLLHDRGLLTGAAYLGEVDVRLPLFQKEVLEDLGLDVESARARYNGVIHLVTAAEGAEEYYTLANNASRTETPEMARILDKRTQEAWLGHPHLAVIPNVDSMGSPITFDQKMDHAVREMCRILGIPEPLEIEDKYLLSSFNPSMIPVRCEAVEIIQWYLSSMKPSVEIRIRKRTWMGFETYFKTTKSPGPDGGRIEIEQHITKNEYTALLSRRDKSKNSIQKIRYCFLWNYQYFEVDVFKNQHHGLILLERERTAENDQTIVPNFLSVQKDVTHDPAYRNGYLAAVKKC